MKSAVTYFTLSCALLIEAQLTFVPAESSTTAAVKDSGSPSGLQDEKKNMNNDFVYADFETVQNKRPVSNRGGLIQLISYEETTPSHFKGLANASPAAPELVRTKKDDPNHAIAFDYQLYEIGRAHV